MGEQAGRSLDYYKMTRMSNNTASNAVTTEVIQPQKENLENEKPPAILASHACRYYTDKLFS